MPVELFDGLMQVIPIPLRFLLKDQCIPPEGPVRFLLKDLPTLSPLLVNKHRLIFSGIVPICA